MGGQYSELDVMTRPLSSSKDFQDRIASWVEHVNINERRENALLVYFSGVKEGLAKQGVDFNAMIGSTCQK